MLSEIGSNFWISPNEIVGTPDIGTPEQFGCKGSDFVWMSTGRSATRMVLQTILQRNPDIKKVALIPAFTCHTVIEPFLDFGFSIHTLPMSVDMMTNVAEITSSLADTHATVLLVHRYYGFDTLPGFNKEIKKIQNNGVVVIEDCTQCLYSTFEISNADYFVGSIRKWCGVPDGGFAVCREGGFLEKPENEDKELQDAKIEASRLKYDYIFNGKDCKPESKQKYREAEHILDTQTRYYTISSSSEIIQTYLDTVALSNARRRNFDVLVAGMHGILGISLVFDTLPQGIVPLYLPILIDEREKIQSLLADNAVYAPVVWPKADCCPSICKEADILYNHLLCIPIDQRYNVDDMQRILTVLKSQE